MRKIITLFLCVSMLLLLPVCVKAETFAEQVKRIQDEGQEEYYSVVRPAVQAQKEAEKEGYNAGYSEGYDAGYSAGAEEMKLEMEQAQKEKARDIRDKHLFIVIGVLSIAVVYFAADKFKKK